MGKIINALSFFLLFVSAFLLVFYHFDLEVGLIRGQNIPYIFEIYLGVTAVVGLLLVIRVTSKWSSYFFFNRIKNFIWEGKMSKQRIYWVTTMVSMEFIYLFAFGTFFLFFDHVSFYLGLVLLILAIEKGLFLLLGSQYKYFRIGMSSKALLFFDRDLQTTPIINAKKADMQSGELFIYVSEEIVFKFPLYAVRKEDLPAFREALLSVFAKKNVVTTPALSNFLEGKE